MLISDLDSLDIGILGAGREGMSAWRWLRHRLPDAPLTVYDEGQAAAGLTEIMKGPNDRLVIGPFDTGALAKHGLLIRSPGISPYRPDLASLRAEGVQFSSASNLWFANHLRRNTICITGTKGKSTTAALTAHLLRKAGCSVGLAGNIGLPLLDCKDKGLDWWVIELSSYQLVDLQAEPAIAAIINLSDEHLDWHGGAEAYRRDKLRLAELAAGAPLIANRSDPDLAGRLQGREGIHWFGNSQGFHVRNNQFWQAQKPIEDLPRRALRGPHNLANLAAALTIASVAGYRFDALAATLADFEALPHRLELLGTIAGISYVNDSLSTTPVATVAALEALQGERIILLLGGMDRGLDWRPLMPHIRKHTPHAVICLPDNGTELAKLMQDAAIAPEAGIQCAGDLEAAMATAARLAAEGDTVLLSPGAPSFPRFRDFAHRGRCFAQLAGFPYDPVIKDGSQE